MPATDETRRLSLRIDRDLKHRVTQEAERRGQSLTVFVERALRATLTTNADPRGIDRAARAVQPIGQDAENERAFAHAQPSAQPPLDRAQAFRQATGRKATP